MNTHTPKVIPPFNNVFLKDSSLIKKHQQIRSRKGGLANTYNFNFWFTFLITKLPPGTQFLKIFQIIFLHTNKNVLLLLFIVLTRCRHIINIVCYQLKLQNTFYNITILHFKIIPHLTNEIQGILNKTFNLQYSKNSKTEKKRSENVDSCGSFFFWIHQKCKMLWKCIQAGLGDARWISSRSEKFSATFVMQMQPEHCSLWGFY